MAFAKKISGCTSDPIRGQDRGRAGATAAPRARDPEGPEDCGGSDTGIRRPCGARAHHAASPRSGGANREETCGSTSGEVRGGAHFNFVDVYNMIIYYIPRDPSTFLGSVWGIIYL